MADKLKQLLVNNTVDSLVSPKGGVIFLDSNEQIVHGFQKLLENNILSAPVWDAKESKYIGFLDIRDLVSFCVFIHDNNLQADTLLDIVNFGAKMFKHAAEGVTLPYLARRNAVHTVKKGSSLYEVSDILSKGVRRLLVTDESGKVINIISQTSIIQFVNKHLVEFKPLFDAKLQEIGIGSAPVLSVSKETRAIDVFRMMDAHSRSGVAVVDMSGTLLGFTSGPDLKLFIQTPSVGVLQLPIMTFLNKIRNQSIDIATPVTTCALHETGALCIGKLVATKSHRVFIVSADYKPEKVVSIVDILRYIVEKTK